MVDNPTNNIDSVEIYHSDGISISSDKVQITLVKNCDGCDFTNFYIWGTVINSELKIQLRCIKCGKEISRITSCMDEVEKDEL
jgi:hypothetical protein